MKAAAFLKVYFKLSNSLTADLLNNLDTLRNRHVTPFPSTEDPISFLTTAWPVAVTFVALKTEALADIIKRLGYFRTS